MKKINFDNYVENYNTILSEQLRFFSEDNRYFSEYKVLELKKQLTFAPKTILDFGCGIGRSTFFLKKHFPNAQIIGCDLSEKSLVKAKKQVPAAYFLHLNKMHRAQMTFDVIFIACVFHHIEPQERLSMLQFIISMSSDHGIVVIFEHNPYNPITCYLVHQCPFDRSAVLLSPRYLKKLFLQAGIKNITHHYTLFFPEKFHRLRKLEYYLRFIPLGGQYMMSAHR